MSFSVGVPPVSGRKWAARGMNSQRAAQPDEEFGEMNGAPNISPDLSATGVWSGPFLSRSMRSDSGASRPARRWRSGRTSSSAPADQSADSFRWRPGEIALGPLRERVK